MNALTHNTKLKMHATHLAQQMKVMYFTVLWN